MVAVQTKQLMVLNDVRSSLNLPKNSSWVVQPSLHLDYQPDKPTMCTVVFDDHKIGMRFRVRERVAEVAAQDERGSTRDGDRAASIRASSYDAGSTVGGVPVSEQINRAHAE